MEQQHCSDCQNYVQHYTLNPMGNLVKVHWGHCIKKRGSGRRPNEKSCDQFVLCENRTSGFVTKQYLRKALLWRILEMELLPEELVE